MLAPEKIGFEALGLRFGVWDWEKSSVHWEWERCPAESIVYRSFGSPLKMFVSQQMSNQCSCNLIYRGS